MSNVIMQGKTLYVAIQGSWRKAGDIVRVPPKPPVFLCWRTPKEIIHNHRTLAEAKEAHAAWWAMSIDILECLRRNKIACTNIVLPKPPRKIYSAMLFKWHEHGIPWEQDPEGRIQLLSLEHFTVQAGKQGDYQIDSWY